VAKDRWCWRGSTLGAT